MQSLLRQGHPEAGPLRCHGDCDRVTGVRTCCRGTFLSGVATFLWACLQYSGPMDLKEKHE
ncbi:hypothetical protein MG293_016923, partial [Ovis ammon polii]